MSVFSVAFPRIFKSLELKNVAKVSLRCLSSQTLTKNIRIYTENPQKFEYDAATLRLTSEPSGKPLAFFLPWLLSKPSHVEKYCAIYTKLGFDVVAVRMELSQLLRPVTGTQVLAKEAVKFLANNDQYEKIVIHGFSAGGYLWGECLIHMQEHEKYEAISKRIKGQVWDSLTASKEISIGVARSVFPDNKFLQKTLFNLSEFYLKTSYEIATKHYHRSENAFNDFPMKVPALMFASKTDQVGTERKSREVISFLEQHKIDVTFKLFEKSPHVQHYYAHKEEYMKLLCEHLKKCKVLV